MISITTLLLVLTAAILSTSTAFVSQPSTLRVSSMKMSVKQEIEVVSQPDKEFLDKKG
jgi:hypothetical protein